MRDLRPIGDMTKVRACTWGPPMTTSLPTETCAQAVSRWARVTPAAIAVVEGATAHSYETLASNIAQAAEMLRSAGLRRGMIVGIQCEARYLHLVLILASETAGAAHLSLAPADLISD